VSRRSELERLLGKQAVSERPVSDLWPLGLMAARAGVPAEPVLAARPETADQVAALLAWARGSGTALVPVGGASGVCGAVRVTGEQVALDMAGFDRVLDVDEANLTCHVQAGVRGADLEAELNRRGLTLGHYPSSLPVSTVGGLISTRSSGQESSRYGSIEDMLLGVTALLPDGTRLEPRPGPRSAAGPALHQLLAGAEGTLAVIVDAVLKVHRLPEREVGRAFAFERLADGLEGMRRAMQAGLRPLVLRLYDPEDSLLQGVDLDGGCLLVAASAGAEGVAEAEAAALARLLGPARDLGEEPWRRWKAHRFELSAERMRQLLEPHGSYLDTIEVAAPWTELAGLHAKVKAALGTSGAALCHFSHAYPQGCCAYFTFAGAAAGEEEARAAYAAAWEATMAAALRHRATISHHHGVGQARAGWIGEEMGGWRRLWEAVRQALDPGGTLNPNGMGGR
jgi:alkyldihydroxyacetonephosphate synthase